ncbi:MAG: hypothetical protein JW780_06040 [Clostridiales bacterium]|nr:hypothetical protein [Clostridiales bacterium]
MRKGIHYRYIPKGSKEVQHPDGLGVAYIHDDGNNRFSVIAYHGKSNRHDFHFSGYNGEAAAMTKVNTFFSNLSRHAEWKAKMKAERKGYATGAAACAAAIRAELKKAFPEVKFTVRSSTFAGGDDVRIGWVDGPSNKEIEAIVSKYEEGHFDGMTDMYEYSNRRDDIPQAKYIFAQKEFSQAARERAIKEISVKYSHWFPEGFDPSAYYPKPNLHGDMILHRYLNGTL